MGKRTAIIHDWLNGMRGGEKVLEELLDIFPDADIFTLFLEEDKISEKIRGHQINTSSLNRSGMIKKRYRYFLPLFPKFIEDFDLGGYDLIISSSHCVAKGVIPYPYSKHISYIHSPMRYAWDQYYSYFGELKGLRKTFIRSRISELRKWDVSSSERVDHFIANSNFVKERIRRYYRRDSEVIHPPVDTDYFTVGNKKEGEHFLTVSALVPYKRVDTLVKAFSRTGDKLIVVGKGPEEKRLKKLAGNNIEFRKDLANESLRELYRNSRAFVYAGIEDFGITFAEAHSCGIPVISYNKGGVTDIVNSDNGILYDSGESTGLLDAVEELKGKKFDREKIRESALRFSSDNFRKKITAFIKKIS
ncbi:MAG: glycosyltransferase [Candidatus Aminicenantes bacterium]|nr:glycosyltransferase [Candidatus Aminicenantes bacterium]